MAIITKKMGNLEYLAAESIPVPHCFSTRLGGVSRGSLSSLNLGIHRGDDPENVVENFRILGEAVGFSPEDTVFTRQIHTDVVRRVGSANRGEGLFTPVRADCDALITEEPGVALTVFTADCTPVLLYDPVTGAVGAAHAGWRGTALGIAGKTAAAMAEQFGTRPEDIRAAIGPNIGVCCFETHREVPQAMYDALGREAEPFILPKGEKFLVDLKGINALWLRKAGVEHIEISGECTACRPDRFWSHRVTGGERGSLAAIIVCKGGKA